MDIYFAFQWFDGFGIQIFCFIKVLAIYFAFQWFDGFGVIDFHFMAVESLVFLQEGLKWLSTYLSDHSYVSSQKGAKGKGLSVSPIDPDSFHHTHSSQRHPSLCRYTSSCTRSTLLEWLPDTPVPVSPSLTECLSPLMRLTLTPGLMNILTESA